MKNYIILTGGISKMGGAEMYTNNKVKYLESQGWKVQVYFFNKVEKIWLDSLKEFEKNYIPELALAISFYTNKQRNTIIEHICSNIGRGEVVVVESQLYGLTIWGELIAKCAKGIHIMNSIEENEPEYIKELAKFFEFKLKRREILNASENALKRHFGPYYCPQMLEYSHSTKLFCSNVVDDDVADELDLSNANFNILSIGRLDKPYVPIVLNEIKLFAESVKDKKLNIIFIGGSPDGKVEETIQKYFEKILNIRVYLLGYMYPISGKLIRKCDVSIASSNSILVSSQQGVPTIAVCAKDYQGMGIYGDTTISRVSRNGEPVQSIHKLLEDVLVNKLYNKKEPISSNNEAIEAFREELAYIENVSNNMEYYDVSSIYPLKFFYQNHSKWLIHKALRKLDLSLLK